ncbi:hypothetical protein [Mesorhizobium australafricanum]|uniref:Uncharacterized protein n=1 Tax=Mesorhizobium australafricanum TaxID=3072311 RepID=A0ABU4X758_9HYPH|nr:hypothetical protein [Mesorhizobium sp. VK3E]MDX8442957.1 hypothetical protein [Mesorhizobium sp. VK3E]
MKRWLEGRAPVPLPVAAWIEAHAKAHRALPPPRPTRPNSATRTTPTVPVVVQAFTAGIGQPQPHGIVLQPPYPRRHALTGTTGLRPADHKPRSF